MSRLRNAFLWGPVLFLFMGCGTPEADIQFAPPGRDQTVLRQSAGVTVLPGGRMLDPLGEDHETGPGPFGLAVSADGATVVTANGGPGRYSLSILRRTAGGAYRVEQLPVGEDEREEVEEDDAWSSVFMGLAFAGGRGLLVSDGNSGKVRLIDVETGAASHVYDLNRGSFSDSYSGDLAYDAEREVVYVADQANFRVAVMDLKKNAVVASQRVGRLPFSLALAPGGRRLYVTNLGMFEYQAIPGVDAENVRETGLEFPAFGFPSEESEKGAQRETARGPVDVPGLGDPNVLESNSLCVLNVEEPENPSIEKFIRTGKPFGGGVEGGSSPSGVVATEDRIFVANGHNDSITVIDAGTLEVVKGIHLRIPGLEGLRGILPIGMAYDEGTGLLFVAEAGINAIGVVDAETFEVAGHIPAAWFPTQVGIHAGRAFVTNAKGFGTGPNASMEKEIERSFQGEMRRGAITTFELPERSELAGLTRRVMELNGFEAVSEARPRYPEALKHVVMIVKENRTYDEVFGDVTEAANGAVNGAPKLARFGVEGWVDGDEDREGLRNVNVTPNHHAMAARWASSDNFYADSEVSVDGHHWLVGSYPNAWTESSLMAAYGGQKDFRFPTTAPGRLEYPQSNSSVHPEEQLEAGALWHHLERHGITFRNFGEGFELAGVDEGEGLKPTGARFVTNVPMPDPLYRNSSRNYPQYNMNIPDQYRADRFIAEIEERYVEGDEEFPRLIYIHLPNDHMAKPRPEDGYPYRASFVADNDYALGRIVEYLSNSRWWNEMAIFITEDDAQGGVDHVDTHRTVFLVASPFARPNYVSHRNASFPGLLKTVFQILGLPPLNLFDATASDLSDCFAQEADFTAYELLAIAPELFVPEHAKEPLDPKPSPMMDDPRVLQRQHERQ